MVKGTTDIKRKIIVNWSFAENVGFGKIKKVPAWRIIDSDRYRWPGNPKPIIMNGKKPCAVISWIILFVVDCIQRQSQCRVVECVQI